MLDLLMIWGITKNMESDLGLDHALLTSATCRLYDHGKGIDLNVSFFIYKIR